MNTLIKKTIGNYIDKKTYRLKMKDEKHHRKSDFFWCILCAKKNKNVSLKNRIKMYRHGFTSDEYVHYRLDKNNYKDYLTDIERWESRKINGDYAVVLDDKRLFYEVFSKYLDIPKTLFFIDNGIISNYDTCEEMTIEQVIKKLDEYDGFVFKPISSGGGKGISVVSKNGDKLYIDFAEKSLEDVKKHIKGNANCLVTEFVNQHSYAKNIYPKTTNTIRVATAQMKDKGATVVLAMHRFGVEESIPVDNACSGGLFSTIDIDTGVVSKAMSYITDESFKNHPETNAQIEGIIVPYWKEILEKIIEVSNKVPYIKFIAWDILVTENGFSVIEGNASTGFGFFQMFEPYRNSKLGEFLKENGIVK